MRVGREKQRHTSKRFFERLCGEHGYAGGITLGTSAASRAGAPGRVSSPRPAPAPWQKKSSKAVDGPRMKSTSVGCKQENAT